EKRSLYQKMEDSFKKQKEENEKRTKQYRLGSVIGGILFVAIAIYAFVISQFVFCGIFAVVGLLLIVLSFFIITKELDHDVSFSREIDELEEKVSQIGRAHV